MCFDLSNPELYLSPSLLKSFTIKSDRSQLSSCLIYVRCFRKYDRSFRREVWKAKQGKDFHKNLHKISRKQFVYWLNFWVVSPSLRWSHCLNYMGLFIKIQQNTLILNYPVYCLYYTIWQHVSVHFEPCPGRQNTRQDMKVYIVIGRYTIFFINISLIVFYANFRLRDFIILILYIVRVSGVLLLQSVYDIQACRSQTFIKITSSDSIFTASRTVFTVFFLGRKLFPWYTGFISISMLNEFQRLCI